MNRRFYLARPKGISFDCFEICKQLPKMMISKNTGMITWKGGQQEFRGYSLELMLPELCDIVKEGNCAEVEVQKLGANALVIKVLNPSINTEFELY